MTPKSNRPSGGSSYAARATPPLVGRRAELDWLNRQLDAAESGEPRLVVIRGDAGIGKSRIARELARRASGRGFAVVSGRCREDLPLPYLPFETSLLPLVAGDAMHDAGPSAAPGGQDLSTGDEHQSMRHFLTLTRATLRFASEHPLFVMIDDLQWIDASSFELLRHIVLGAADAALRESVPIIILCTYRPGVDARLEADLARLRREDLSFELELHGLTEPEAVELIRALGGPNVDRRLTAAVYRATEGNALFIEAVVHDLPDDGGDIAASLQTAALPADLDQALRSTLAHLRDDDREVLTAGAILGHDVALDDLQQIRSADAVEHALTAGESLGVLRRHAGRAAFTHPLYAHLLRATPDGAARRRYHLEIADALAAATDGSRALEVALHLIEAADDVDPARMLQACDEGAAQARTLFAWGDAARCDDAAVAAATSLHRSEIDLAELHLRAGTAHRRNLDDAAARTHLEEAAAIYRRRDDPARLATTLVELGRVELTSGRFAKAIDLEELDSLADRLETEDPALCAHLLAQMAVWFTSLDWLDKATAFATRALATASRTSDDAAAVQSQVALATLAWTRLDLHDARARLEDALSRAEAGDDALLLNWPRPRLALTLLWLGRIAEADAMAQRAIDGARRTADWGALTLALAAALGVATVRGELDRAEEIGDEAWLALRLSGYRWGAAFVLPALTSARIARGDLEGARKSLLDWRALSTTPEEDAPAGIVVDVAELLIDAMEGGPVVLPEWIAPALPTWPVRIGALMLPVVLVMLNDAGRSTVDPEVLEYALTRIAESGMVVTDGLLALVPRLRGLCSDARGRFDEAQARLIDAVEVARGIGAHGERLRAEIDLARILSRSGDREAAAERARRAANEAGTLGMIPLATTATALVADVGTERRAPRSELSAATAVILFTDLVGSTDLTELMGDAAYREVADRLDAQLREIVDRRGGEAVPGIRLGDGLLALFPSATGALGFAKDAHVAAAGLELAMRIGVHAGDMIRAGDVVSGGAVNIAARVCDLAGPGETLVSETVRSLARTSSGTMFTDRGMHTLKGVSDPHQLFSASAAI